MPTSVIDSVLLFALAIPVVMKYRILPVDGTPYWLFGVLFLALLANCVISYAPYVLGRFKKHIEKLKNALLVLVVLIVVGGTTSTAMVDRAHTAPVFGVHDIILQQEAAMRYLLVGKNPYKETYFGTFVEDFNYDEPGNIDAVNPALFHFVMPPWYVVFPFAFYYTVRPVVGFFDGRMVLLFSMAMLLYAVWHWFRDKHLARLAIILTALSPAAISFFIEGRSDVFALSWLVVSFVFLQKKRYVWSAIMMALAFLSKQTTWFAVPFYLVVLWTDTGKHRKAFWKAGAAGAATGLVIALPFFLWDASAFLDSTILYLSGNAPHSYPVGGYGVGMLLYSAGIIRDIHAYYPFVFWQIVLCVPLLAGLIAWMKPRPSQSNMVMSYAVFLMVFWYVSRYFNNSHLGYISMLFVLGGLKGIDEGII